MTDIRLWIGYGYELLITMVPAAVLLFIFHSIYKRRNISVTPRHAVYLMIFSFYLFGVFHFTGVGTVFDAKQYGLELNPEQMNWIPFSDTDIDFVSYGLNVVLFVPFGFLLPFIWSSFQKYRPVFLAGITFSALIEISQLLNNRSTDVDDLILNTAGAISCAVFFHVLSRLTKHKPAARSNDKYEAYVYILFIFLCRFFFYNEFGLAKMLYGF